MARKEDKKEERKDKKHDKKDEKKHEKKMMGNEVLKAKMKKKDCKY